MGDQEDRSEVRRFGRKDRKRRLDPSGPLIPPEENPSEADARFAPPSVVPAKEEPVPEPDLPLEPAAPVDRFPPLEHKTESLASASQPEKLSKAAPARRGGTCLYNLLTLVFMVGTVAALVWVVLVAQNPYSKLNPFPPFTPMPVIITATFLPATDAPPPTAGPTATFTLIPVEALDTPVPAETTREPSFAFKLATDGPVYIPNGNEKACDWLSIAGSVTDATGSALNGYGVHITSDDIDNTVFSGAAITFGPGGFELFLNGAPQEKTYRVRLVSAQGEVLSPEYNVTTQASCDQNVAVMSFVPS